MANDIMNISVKGMKRISILLLLCCLGINIASAAVCNVPVNTDTALLVTFSRNMDGCLMFDKKQHPLTKQIHQLFSQKGMTNQGLALQALNVVEVELQNRFSGEDQGSQLRERIKGLRMALTRSTTPGTNLKADWQWVQRDRSVSGIEFLDFDSLLSEERCPTGQAWSLACKTAFKDASLLGVSIHIANAAIDRFSQAFRELVEDDRRLRMNKWDSYYDDLTFQYPWEMYLNNTVIDAADTRSTLNGNKQGFRPLPTSKVVILHPEIGLVYDNQVNNKIEEVLNVEVIGFEKFSFNNVSGRVQKPWGISVIASYLQDKKGESGWRAGLLMKYKGYSFGISDNNSEAAFMLNLNLSKLLFRVEDDARKYKNELQQRTDNWKVELQH